MKLWRKSRNLPSRMNRTTSPTNVVEGIRKVRITHYAHDVRHQSVMLIPIPRFAEKKFYDDWCYQPYMRNHEMIMSDDIFAPLQVAPIRFIIHRFPSLSYFHPGNMPAPLELGISRREFMKKEVMMRSPFLHLVLLTANAREKRCRFFVERHIRGLLGETYMAHPGGEQKNQSHRTQAKIESFVFLLNPAWIPYAMEALSRLEFRMTDCKEVDVGKHQDLIAIEQTANFFNCTVLYYLLFLFIICTMASLRSFMIYGKEIREKERNTREGK